MLHTDARGDPDEGMAAERAVVFCERSLRNRSLQVLKVQQAQGAILSHGWSGGAEDGGAAACMARRETLERRVTGSVSMIAIGGPCGTGEMQFHLLPRIARLRAEQQARGRD